MARVRTHGPFFWRQQRLAALARRRTEAIFLGDYLRLVRRYRRVLAASLVIGFLAGLVAAALKPPVWVSGATVLVNAVALDPQEPPDKAIRPRKAVTIDTEAAFLLSDRVLRRAVAGTSLTPPELAAETQLSAAPNSRVIKIQILDRAPDRARLLVANLADAYLDARRQLLNARRSAQVAAVEREIAVLQLDRVGPQAGTTESIDSRLAKQRYTLAHLEAEEIDAGELLRSATVPRKSTRDPQVQIVSLTLLGLVAGGLLILFRERRPAAPRTPADIHRLPIAGKLPVALLDRDGPVDDRMGGWVGIADAIGAAPVVTLIISLDTSPLGDAVHTLTLSLRRRGYLAEPMIEDDHESPAPDGATATMLRVRASGSHLVGAGPALADLDTSLSTTQTDNVVLMFAPGLVSERELDAAIDRVVRLGIPVLGIILDLAHARHSRLRRLTRAAS